MLISYYYLVDPCFNNTAGYQSVPDIYNCSNSILCDGTQFLGFQACGLDADATINYNGCTGKGTTGCMPGNLF